MKRIAIVGAGGFAREIAWLIRDINAISPQFEVVCHLVSDGIQNDAHANQLCIRNFSWLARNADAIDSLVMGVGFPGTKRKLVTQLMMDFPRMEWPSIIHPSVKFDRSSTIFGKGVVLCAGSIATVNVEFRDFSMVNLMCTIGHESTIGEFSVLNPTVNISGNVQMEPGVLVGTGAQVLQNLTIGENATIGAGSVVTKPVSADTTVIGIPAKPLVQN